MITIYMCRVNNKSWTKPAPATVPVFDDGTAILGPLIRENLIRFPTDPKYTIETIGL